MAPNAIDIALFKPFTHLPEIEPIIASNKEMHVIRHDYITTNPYVEFLYASEGIFSKGRVRGVQVINFTSMESTDCDKKKSRIIELEKLLQARGAVFDHRTSVRAAVSVAIQDLRAP